MLIYNHKQELVGIDSEDLRMLGFSSLKEMFSECRDIAEFFVKKPGYIHNFKNFKWIDYILHAEASTPKAIIQTSQRGFGCDIVITPFFLAEAPDEKAYAITLAHIKPLSGYDEADFAKEAPVAEKRTPVEEKITAAKPPKPTEEPLSIASAPSTPQPGPETFSAPAADNAAFDPYDHEEDLLPAFNKPLDIEEDLFLSSVETPAVPAEEPEEFFPEAAPEAIEAVPQKTPVEEAPMLGDYLSPKEQGFIDNLTIPKDYVYNPQIAADELGLPVDLIEEFIGDFIQQAHDFHDELFEMAAKSDFDNVKILSHKLKGVAANLRIEDAFEILTVINISNDQAEIQADLKHFYRMIDKLEGKETEPSPAMETAAVAPAVNEITADIFEAEEEPPLPQSDTDDDLYAFDIITEKHDAASSPAIPAAEEVEDDLYDFDMAVAGSSHKEEALSSSEPEAVPQSEQESDLYAFDTTANEEISDTSFDLPPMPEEDDYELPPMDFELSETAPSAASAEENIQTPEISPADEEAQDVLHYDTAKVADELGLSFEIVHELLNDFVADAILAKSALENAVAASKSDIWKERAARLKGITDNLRMLEISQTLHTLSHTDDAKEADKAIHKLYGYVDQL